MIRKISFKTRIKIYWRIMLLSSPRKVLFLKQKEGERIIFARYVKLHIVAHHQQNTMQISLRTTFLHYLCSCSNIRDNIVVEEAHKNRVISIFNNDR
jgi:hypothetical protein